MSRWWRLGRPWALKEKSAQPAISPRGSSGVPDGVRPSLLSDGNPLDTIGEAQITEKAAIGCERSFRGVRDGPTLSLEDCVWTNHAVAAHTCCEASTFRFSAHRGLALIRRIRGGWLRRCQGDGVAKWYRSYWGVQRWSRGLSAARWMASRRKPNYKTRYRGGARAYCFTNVFKYSLLLVVPSVLFRSVQGTSAAFCGFASLSYVISHVVEVALFFLIAILRQRAAGYSPTALLFFFFFTLYKEDCNGSLEQWRVLNMLQHEVNWENIVLSLDTSRIS